MYTYPNVHRYDDVQHKFLFHWMNEDFLFYSTLICPIPLNNSCLHNRKIFLNMKSYTNNHFTHFRDATKIFKKRNKPYLFLILDWFGRNINNY